MQTRELARRRRRATLSKSSSTLTWEPARRHTYPPIQAWDIKTKLLCHPIHIKSGHSLDLPRAWCQRCKLLRHALGVSYMGVPPDRRQWCTTLRGCKRYTSCLERNLVESAGKHICATETFGTNSGDVSVWEHVLDLYTIPLSISFTGEPRLERHSHAVGDVWHQQWCCFCQRARRTHSVNLHSRFVLCVVNANRNGFTSNGS